MKEDPEHKSGSVNDQEQLKKSNIVENDDNDNEPEFENLSRQDNLTVYVAQELSKSKIRSLIAVATSLVKTPD